MPVQDTPVLIVAGPTASGKSGAAAMLGRMLGGQVINADSMQVYADLKIITARPTAKEQAQVTHYLYGHVDGSEGYSAGRFVREAMPIIRELRRQSVVPILCGGTGLYLKALTEGLSPIPEVPLEHKARAEADWENDPRSFRARLVARDPEMERLEPADRQRHVRAASVLSATGRTLSSWQDEPKEKALDGPVLGACLLPAREELYARCDRRFDQMIERGAVGEVAQLLMRQLPPTVPVMKSLGVPELTAHIRGDLSLEEAAAMAKQETRRFAKRQMTWFRNQTDWPVYDHPEKLITDLRASVV